MGRRHRVIGYGGRAPALLVQSAAPPGRKNGIAIPASFFAHLQFHRGMRRDVSTATLNHGGRMEQHTHGWDESNFEITSKRRKGFPSEMQVKRGTRVVHGNKELFEKLGRNDPCPCGSGRSF